MFDLFSRSRRALPRGRFVQLKLDSLEARDCPSASPFAGHLGLFGPAHHGGMSPNANHPNPVISNFMAVEGYNNVWTFTGRVADDAPGGLTVHLGGLPSLANATAVTGADGTFQVSVQLRVNETGIATAVVTDSWGLVSNTAMCLVYPTGPIGGHNGGGG